MQRQTAIPCPASKIYLMGFRIPNTVCLVSLVVPGLFSCKKDNSPTVTRQLDLPAGSDASSVPATAILTVRGYSQRPLYVGTDDAGSMSRSVF